MASHEPYTVDEVVSMLRRAGARIWWHEEALTKAGLMFSELDEIMRAWYRIEQLEREKQEREEAHMRAKSASNVTDTDLQ